MNKFVGFVLTLALACPLIAVADLSSEDLPANTQWYFHADLERMRTTESGQALYAWLEDEVIVEVNEKMQINLNDEVDSITAFSEDGSGLIAIIEGGVSQDLKDKLLALAFAQSGGGLDQTEYRDALYYKAGDDSGSTRINANDSIRHSGYFTFAVDGKILIASEEDQMRALIDSGGNIPGAGSHNDAILILSAEKQFVQAGVRTAEFADDGNGWDSNILRNTEEAALLVSGKGALVALDVKLVGTDPAMTQSLGSIVNGVIALQAFSGDLDPEVAQLLRNTRVSIDGKTLNVSTVVDPANILKLMAD